MAAISSRATGPAAVRPRLGSRPGSRPGPGPAARAVRGPPRSARCWVPAPQPADMAAVRRPSERY